MKVKEKPTCINCGAPLTGTKCEYCGTEYENLIDGIEIDSWTDKHGILHRKIQIENRMNELEQRKNELKFQIAHEECMARMRQTMCDYHVNSHLLW